jgi:endonuclease YncB( thermonuclease family)
MQALWFKVNLIALGFLFACPLHAATEEQLSGKASVIDGDTIEIHSQRIRLHGIDAPESRQLCKNMYGKNYRCGQIAAIALADYIGGQTVTCQNSGKDRYKRAIGQCSIKDSDLGKYMVSHGYALAYTKYSKQYVSAQLQAQQSSAGIWAGEFTPPWEWRKRKAN